MIFLKINPILNIHSSLILSKVMIIKNMPNKNISYKNNSLLRLWKLLNTRNKIKIFIQLFFIICNGFAEICSLALVVPFLAFLSNPNIFWELKISKILTYFFNIEKSEDIILPLTCAFIFVNILAAILKLINIRMSAFTSASIGTDLSCKIFKSTLSKEFEEHLNTNTSEIVSTSTTLLDSTVSVINYIFQSIAAVFVGLSIIITLLFINTKITFIATFIFLIIYGFIGITIRESLNKNSKSIVRNTKSQVKNIQESLGGIRDIILDGLQGPYIEIYKKNDQTRRFKQAENQFLALFPRFGVEAIVLTSIAIFSYQLSRSNTEQEILPLIGTFAFGAQRLLPSIQMTYAAWAGIKANINSIDSVLGLIKIASENEKNSSNIIEKKDPLFFKEYFELKNIYFKYSNSDKYQLKNINLKIYKGEKIGIVGPTGSGKSTLIDVIMGMLKPTSGILKVDDKNIYLNQKKDLLNSWYLNISHVPQTIYLTDKTVLENIAFGVKSNNINFGKVEKAAKVASIDKFINKLNLKYYSKIGEDGTQISGGQRQRIGLARALYKDSSILILDEATSALDKETENKVMRSIEKLSEDVTIIIIAHRISSLKYCDRLIYIKDGEIIKEGVPDDILYN